MDERTKRISDLLHEAGETHHIVFRITDGADDDWATWYSNWLLTMSELPELLGRTPPRSELTTLLVELDREYTDRHPSERWEDHYDTELARRYPGAG